MSRLTPSAWYQAQLASGQFLPDEAQAEIVDALQQVHQALTQEPRRRGWLRRTLRPEPVRGLYIWGSVGRGKTWMMDSFYESLPFANKRRIHFHRFMEDVHDRLRQLPGEADPLTLIGETLASEFRVLCFDEFHVSDIGDAMLLAGLFDCLFRHGVCLVATSNVPPDDLYREGLQRAKFLPAIELIKTHTRVIRLRDGQDFRLRILSQADIFHTPCDDQAIALLDEAFRQLAPGEICRDTPIDINHRRIDSRALSDGVVWFDFEVLCKGHRSAADYIEIARQFNTVMISGLHAMSDEDNNTTRRFINLIDEFYDRRINLMIASDAPLQSLYTGQQFAFEFERTRSRLIEMQSKDYLADAHVC